MFMRNFEIKFLFFALIGLLSARNIHAQLSDLQFKQYKETWENEKNEIKDRWNAAFELCISHYVELNPDSGIYYADQYYISAIEARDTANSISALYGKYYSLFSKGGFAESVSVLEEILKLSQASGNQAEEAVVQTELGSICMRIGDCERGADCLFRGIDLYFEMEPGAVKKSDLVEIVDNIAQVYYLLNDGESATPYLNWVNAQNPDFLGAVNSVSQLNNLGYGYLEMNDTQRAKKEFMKALAFGERPDPTYGRTLLGLGDAYRKEHHFDSALYYFEKALPIMEQTDHHSEEVILLGGLGKVHLEKKEFEKARDYGMRALPMAKSMKSLPHLILTTSVLYEAYKGLGESTRSLEFYEQYVQAKEDGEARDIYLQVKGKEFTEILQGKEKELLAQLNQTDVTHRRTVLLFTGGFVLFLSVLLFYFYRRLLKKKKERQTLIEQIDVLKKESRENRLPTSKSDLEKLDAKTLDKEKIEGRIDGKLNQTDWKVLNALLENPVITNKEIAEMIFLSVPGVRSSLQKMYRLFDIDRNSGNRRIALVLAAVRISSD